jgi:hypothetical protein
MTRAIAISALVAIGLVYTPLVVVVLGLGYLALNPNWRQR